MKYVEVPKYNLPFLLLPPLFASLSIIKLTLYSPRIYNNYMTFIILSILSAINNYSSDTLTLKLLTIKLFLIEPWFMTNHLFYTDLKLRKLLYKILFLIILPSLFGNLWSIRNPLFLNIILLFWLINAFIVFTLLIISIPITYKFIISFLNVNSQIINHLFLPVIKIISKI